MKDSTKLQLAGYGALALAGLAAEPAHAQLVTSDSMGFIPFTVSGTNLVNFGPGVGNVFQFSAQSDYDITTTTTEFGTFTSTSTFVVFAIQRGGDGANQQALVPSGRKNPRRLLPGYLISSGRPFANVGTRTTNPIAGSTLAYWNGADGERVRGFLGFRFESSALSPGFHYGWFDISYDNTPSFSLGTLTIHGWAYETSNRAVVAGGGSGGAAPEPGSFALVGLGLLSCGAAGLRKLRDQSKN